MLPSCIQGMKANKKFIRHTAGIIVAVILYAIWGAFLSDQLKAYKVISRSMDPTLKVKDHLIISTLDFDPHRSQIITFPDPETGDPLVKRVIAIEGDKVSIRNGEVSVNGLLDRNSDIRVEYRDIDVEVEDNTVFIMGDNRNNSFDSLDFGCFPVEKIEGKVLARYFPFNAIRIF